MPGRPSGDRPSAPWRLAGFVLAVLGIVLVAVTPNPPATPLHWVQVIAGASLTGFLTTYAGWHELVRRRMGRSGTRAVRWLVRRRVAVGAAVVLTAALVVGVPPAWDFARGVSIDVSGCAPATQLRMVASQETVVTARRLAGAYERWTAAENHDCPRVDVYVYAAGADEIRARMQEGWQESGALQEIGPQPDIWLAATSHEVADLGVASTVTPIAVSPLVIAMPEAMADRDAGAQRSWAELFRRLTDQGVDVVRADPGSTEVGLLAAALLYGLPGQDGGTSRQRLVPAEVERRVAASLDHGGFPLTDTPGLLCRHRMLGSQAAVIASEQDVVRFNLGERLGAQCLAGTGDPGRLVARYPSDTRGLDHQFVRLAWSAPPQQEAAAAFGDWLRSEPGREAIVGTGLRPLGTFAIGPPLTTGGIDPTAELPESPVAAQQWSETAAAYDAAQPSSRVLFAVDRSGSMAAPAPGGTRSAAAAAAVSATLDGLRQHDTAQKGAGRHDEFGVWMFPDAVGTGHLEAVPLGPLDETRLATAGRALRSAPPAGNTPLFRTMVDAATLLRSDDPSRIDAVVVLTDGQDTSSGLGPDAVSAALAGTDVRLIVVTIGEIRCSDPALSAITAATTGQCIDGDLANLDAALREATAGVGGGR